MMSSFYNEYELEQIGFKQFGNNVKISKKCSIYMPEKISIGNNVRIDDFCCLVGGEKGITIGSYIHMAFFCILLGNGGITLKDFSGLSSRVSLYSATDDYSGSSLTNPTIPEEYLNITKGEIILNKHVIVGTNSTILPQVVIGEGCSIGANSLVTKNLEPWGIYVGSPAKKIKDRKKDLLLMETQLLNNTKADFKNLIKPPKHKRSCEYCYNTFYTDNPIKYGCDKCLNEFKVNKDYYLPTYLKK